MVVSHQCGCWELTPCSLKEQKGLCIGLLFSPQHYTCRVGEGMSVIPALMEGETEAGASESQSHPQLVFKANKANESLSKTTKSPKPKG